MDINPKDFSPAKSHARLTTGAMLRMLREKKGWTQSELAKRSGITPSNLSLLENDHVEIGKHRAEALAHAFGIHPALIMFPDYEAKDLRKAA